MSICVGGVATVGETREVGAMDGCTGEMLQRMGGGVATYRVLQQTVGEVLQPTGKVGATDGWTEAVATTSAKQPFSATDATSSHAHVHVCTDCTDSTNFGQVFTHQCASLYGLYRLQPTLSKSL